MKKIIIRLLLFIIFIAILAVGGFFAYDYYLNMQNQEVEDKFYSYVFKNNFKNIFDFNLEENIINKMEKEDFVSKTKFDFSSTLKNESNFDFNKFTIEANTKTKEKNKFTTLKFNYSNNELFNLDVLSNPNYIAFKNSDIVTNYIGIRRDRIMQNVSKINPNVRNLYKNFEDLKKENIINQNDENILNKDLSAYIDSLKKYISSKNYMYEGSKIIEQDGEKIEAEVYSLTMSKDDFLRMYAALSEQISNDENIRNAIIAERDNTEIIGNIESSLNASDVVIENKNEIYSMRGTETNSPTQEITYEDDEITETALLKKIENFSNDINSKIEKIDEFELVYKGIKYIFAGTTEFGIVIDEEDLKNDIDRIFEVGNKIIDEKVSEDASVKIVTYIANNETIKTSLIFGENLEVDLDYINQNNKYSAIITVSEKIDESYNGYKINFTKNKTSAIDNNSIEIGKIENNQIVTKLDFKLNVEGTANSNKYTNDFSFIYSGAEGKVTSNISNSISFENSEIDVITGENTVLIDALEGEKFYTFINKLNSRMENVYEEKISKLNLIDANVSDTIIKRNETENPSENSENEKVEKEKLINLLVENISNEMGRAQEEGKEYTIQDLKNLQIEGYNIQTSVSNDIAIIKINNYTFKIDKDFNLSE